MKINVINKFFTFKIGPYCLFLMLTVNLFAQVEERKNIFGFGTGISHANGVWVGNPANIWADVGVSPVFQVFYTRQIRESLRLGSYFEYESAKFNLYNFGNSDAFRYTFGFNWLTLYPNTSFHGQLGGYFGYGLLSFSNWDQSLNGVDYGIIAGPAYEKDNFGIALHIHVGFDYFKSTGVPSEIDASIPRYFLKIYYKF